MQELRDRFERLIWDGDSKEDAAQKLGYSAYRTVWRKLNTAGLEIREEEPNVSFDTLPPVDNISDLLARRKQQFLQKAAHEKARKLITVRVKDSGPIGILHLGDPHVDDDGTDIGLLEEHMKIVQKTQGLYVANVGDTTNNWIGRLARLYAQQSTSAAQAWLLAEWLFKEGRGKWLYIIGGNHDAWSGDADPLKWIARQEKALYQPSECRMRLLIPGAPGEIRINARHDFKGHSMWNPAHGPASATIKGVRDHIAICGHKHISGLNMLKCPETHIITHCIQVASYKLIDRYAMEGGFKDQTISPSVITLINHNAKTPAGLVNVYHDIEQGVDILKYWRRKK